MPILIGGLDPIKLSEGILNALVAKGIITLQEAEAIVEAARGK